jgi:polysaccharide export outer membrane protein
MKRLCLLLIAVVAVAGPAFAQDLTPPSPVASDAPIGARDVLDIRVFQDPSLNSRVTVMDDGRITFPLIGKVEVAGMTPGQVEQRIRTALEAKYLSKADVTVIVAQAMSKPISVIGAVTRPGPIAATGNISLIQAITQAGGLSQGYGKQLYVLRTGAKGLTEQIAVDIDDLMVRGNPDLNIPLMPNDVINVPVDTPITIYVLGEVMHPGTVQFRRSQTPTLLQALAGAGGPTDRAGRTVVIKRNSGGKETTMKANYRRIIDGSQPDVTLQDGDTLFLRESVF